MHGSHCITAFLYTYTTHRRDSLYTTPRGRQTLAYLELKKVSFPSCSAAATHLQFTLHLSVSVSCQDSHVRHLTVHAGLLAGLVLDSTRWSLWSRLQPPPECGSHCNNLCLCLRGETDCSMSMLILISLSSSKQPPSTPSRTCWSRCRCTVLFIVAMTQ
jgi:hypothetical protein